MQLPGLSYDENLFLLFLLSLFLIFSPLNLSEGICLICLQIFLVLKLFDNSVIIWQSTLSTEKNHELSEFSSLEISPLNPQFRGRDC
ncbi:hypothetical protein I7I48_08156 [Histoplasma ohiense]|nr:hypothetical protein I7I48_08156 [Histoplasma ohiense (nom. inval.)]